MKNFSILFLLVLVVSFIKCGQNKDKANQSTEQIVKQMIDSLTLEQKVQILIGTGMKMDLPDSIMAKFNFGKKNKVGVENDSAYMAMVDKIRSYLPGAAGFSAEIPELGITTQVLADGPAGLRISPKRKNTEQTFYCTAFPTATLLASTWNTDLVNLVGKSMGNEALEYGADVILGPGMNLQRDLLCGRNFEYYSEDPLITGKMAAYMVKGIQSNGVGTSIKHFAVNNQETNRLSVNTIVSERALRELYLRGFEIAVTESQPWTVMSAYNKVNGVYASESNDLLTKILRDDWGFKGYVMTDWGAGSDVVAQMKAGNDMIMPGTPEQIEALIAAVKEGKMDESILDKNLSRIFTIMLQTPKYKNYLISNKPDLNAHAQITREVAAEGMVLLENRDKTLPFTSEMKNVAAFGNASYEFIAGGTGSGDVNEAYTVSLLQGLKNANITVNSELADIYTTYITETRAKMPPPKNWLAALLGGKEPVMEMKIDKKLVEKLVGVSDIAIVTIGRNAGESGDRRVEKGDYLLNDNEMSLIKLVSEVYQAKGKKVVVVLNIGGPIEVESWKSIPDAILCAWQPGQEGGNSVVDVLTGKVNPSGKLAITFPVKYEDSPTAKNFPGHAIDSNVKDNAKDLSGFSFMQREPWEVVYEEDIYVGYRYYNTFNVNVSYEFGFGLSYTSFEYSNLKLSSNEFTDKITVSVDVKNTGNVSGKEVVQMYLSAPSVKMKKPVAELKSFSKTKLLNPGEAQTLVFEINAIDLCSFDNTKSSWVAEAGTYTVKVGSSSRKMNASIEFTLSEEKTVKTVSKALLPERQINYLFY